MKHSFADRVLDFAEYCAITQRTNVENMARLKKNLICSKECPPSCKLCRIWRSCKRNDRAMSKVRKLLKKKLGGV